MNNYLFRSLMFVPGHNEKLLASASKSNADVLLLDIEDSVQPVENKQVARDKITKWISKGSFKNHFVFPRVNDRESGELLKDVYQLTIDGVHGFMYPKKVGMFISLPSCWKLLSMKKEYLQVLSKLYL